MNHHGAIDALNQSKCNELAILEGCEITVDLLAVGADIPPDYVRIIAAIMIWGAFNAYTGSHALGKRESVCASVTYDARKWASRQLSEI